MEFYSSPLEKLYQWEADRKDSIFLEQPANDQLYSWTWAEAAGEIRRMATALKDMDLKAGSHIAMLSKNCAHWIMADLAIMMSGHVSVPLYPNQTPENLSWLLEHSESVLMFVGKLDDWDTLKTGIPDQMPCISFPLYGPTEDGYLYWEDMIDEHEPMMGQIIRPPDDLMTIIYTSGTTGSPKGAMHRFYNFSFAASNAMKVLGFNSSDRFFSYLPLCHIAERMVVEMAGIYTGGSVAFAQSLDTFRDDLVRAQPTSFLGVPRIWVKFRDGILSKMNQKKLGILLKIPMIKSRVKKQIRKKLGFQNAHSLFVGAAPMPISLLQWYNNLGMQIREAYAMTENCCYSHVTLNDKIKFGYVGRALPQCEVRLGKLGEIQVRHAALMQGYYKEPDKTKEAFTEDGFLHTGDTGTIDEEGFLKITGRVKDRFKTSKGKYVEPAPIELKLQSEPLISQACVVGTGIPHPIGLITLAETADEHGKEEISRRLSELIEQVNLSLEHHENLSTIVVLKDEWTVENGILTPTMKVKRAKVENSYGDNYSLWHEYEENVIFHNYGNLFNKQSTRKSRLYLLVKMLKYLFANKLGNS